MVSRVKDLLQKSNIKYSTDNKRGLDHGVFAPLKLSFPEADIPVVELSILRSLDTKAHIDIGKALAPLRDEGVLIIGSGSTTHGSSKGNHKEDVYDFINWITVSLLSLCLSLFSLSASPSVCISLSLSLTLSLPVSLPVSLHFSF